MTFEELLSLASSKNPPQIRTDSRLVRGGDIFVAVRGTVCDGHDFIDQALANGAGYIVCESGGRDKAVIVEDSATAAAILAQAAKGNPASRLTNLAVTGTNGKTTVAFLVRCCIRQAGEKCGLIGTVLYDTCSGRGCDAALTTPDCLTIAAGQEEMVKNGAKFMVIEASSHALSQNRLANIDFRTAAFTNLSGDHLDYHKTKEAYLEAKTRLFSSLSPDSVAVLNIESPEAEYIASRTEAKILWYGIDTKADLTAHIESLDINETVFTIEYKGQSVVVRTALPGRYNICNHLAAAGLCLSAGFDLDTIAAGLSALQAVPGRLEKIDWNGPFSVIIDYAHTDDALKNVLATLKPLCRGKLSVVFGCGGDRDRTKRPRMAKVAEQFADFIIVTSDNPRTENPDAIINEIVAGFENGPLYDASCVMRRANNERDTQYAIRDTKLVEPDRAKAIELAIKNACKDDIVLIAGKGHETYQIIGKTKIHFSDKEIAQQFLEKIRRKSETAV